MTTGVLFNGMVYIESTNTLYFEKTAIRINKYIAIFMKPYGINGTMESIADTHHITLFNNCIEELSKVDQFIVVSLSGDQCSGWIALKK